MTTGLWLGQLSGVVDRSLEKGQATGGSVFSIKHVEAEIAVEYFKIEISNRQSNTVLI